MSRYHLLFVLAALALTACPDENKKRPLGSTCDDDSQCASGACIAGQCLDPEADDDGDGLINRIEGALGTNPELADSDGDGVGDAEEVGNAASPNDSDEDGHPDAVEPSNGDADSDCIADQFDPNDGTPEADPAELAKAVCNQVGVCGSGGATASCPAGATQAVCDFLPIAAYEAEEITCDGKDNDCDGETDEAFKTGGTITFDGGQNPADQNKVLGDSCGTGACAGGSVVCSDSGNALTCSTTDQIGPAACTGDGDCNGIVDTVQIANPLAEDLAGCTPFYSDTDHDQHGVGAAHCLCVASGDFTSATADDCDAEARDIYPGAPGICGQDADCDDDLKDADEGCDDGNTDYEDGCYECGVVEKNLGALGQYAGNPHVANLDGGGYVVGWYDGDNVQQESSYGRVLAFFDAGGKLVKRVEGLGLEERATYDYRWDLVALRGGGAIYGYWKRNLETQDYTFIAQRYSNAGEAATPVTVIDHHPYGSYANVLVPLAPGAYGFLEQTDTGEVEVHYVDAADKLSETVGTFTLPQFQADGLADGTIVVLYVDENAGGAFVQKIDANAKLVGEPITVPAIADRYFRDASVTAVEGGGWIVFLLSYYYADDFEYAEVGYQRFSATGELSGSYTVLTSDDQDGCPYDVRGDVDGAGNVFAAIYDGECGSRARGWYEVGGEVTFLDLQTERYPDSNGGFDLDGGAIPVFVFDFENDATSYDQILLRRYTTGGTPLYVPDAAR